MSRRVKGLFVPGQFGEAAARSIVEVRTSGKSLPSFPLCVRVVFRVVGAAGVEEGLVSGFEDSVLAIFEGFAVVVEGDRSCFSVGLTEVARGGGLDEMLGGGARVCAALDVH